MNARERIEPADFGLEAAMLAGLEIDLVEEHHVGESDLLARFVMLELHRQMPRVGDRHDRIERESGARSTSSSTNDWITGAGSASPLVSITTRSN